jgi:hypothetical protein
MLWSVTALKTCVRERSARELVALFLSVRPVTRTSFAFIELRFEDYRP